MSAPAPAGAATAGSSAQGSSGSSAPSAPGPSSRRQRTPSASASASGDAAWYDGMREHLAVPSAWPEENERVLLEPYTYLAAHPGKEIRSRLIDAFNAWLGLEEAKLDVVRKVVGMLHTSSLLMDDVEDNSELRRGIPVAHKIYGVPQTINTANYVYFQVFALIFAMGAPSLPSAGPSVEKLLVEELIALHRGQGMDLFWRDSLVCPTEAEYVDMVNNKTGGLLRIALKLMLAHSARYHRSAAADGEQQSHAQQQPDLLPLVNLIGLLFQIRDDYMNLQSAAYASNKGFAEDLTEGKFSFPIIHSIRSSAPSGGAAGCAEADEAGASSGAPSQQQQERAAASANVSAGAPGGNRQLLSILRQRPTDEATKRYAVAYMRSVTRSFAYTRNVMRRLARQVELELQAVERVLGENRALKAIVKRLEEGWGDEDDED